MKNCGVKKVVTWFENFWHDMSNFMMDNL